MSGSGERNEFLNIKAEVIADRPEDRVYFQNFLPHIHGLYRKAEYRGASALAWQASIDGAYAWRILNGRRIDISDTALMGIATALAFELSKDKDKKRIFSLRDLYFGQLKNLRDEDLAYYAEVYGWNQGVGGDKTRSWKPRRKEAREELQIWLELTGRAEIEDDDEEDE